MSRGVGAAAVSVLSSVPALAEADTIRIAKQYGLGYLQLMIMEDQKLVEKRAKEAGPAASRFNDIHRIVSNLAVFDVRGPDDTVRVLSVHPGVTVDEVREATGFELATDGDVPVTREPTTEELVLIREVLDPKALRHREVPEPEGSK